MAQILAIEADPEEIGILRRVVGRKLGADMIVADSITSAIGTLEVAPPDVVLTSSLLSAGDDQRLADHLRRYPHSITCRC